jgi:hypothetical protein
MCAVYFSHYIAHHNLRVVDTLVNRPSGMLRCGAVCFPKKLAESRTKPDFCRDFQKNVAAI